jgi:hypothetical protein
MARKDYVEFARILKAAEVPPPPGEDRVLDRSAVIEAIAAHLLRDNPRFDRKRFFAAIGD